MNDEDLSDTSSLLATLPVEDHGDLITILVDIAAKDFSGSLDALEDASEEGRAAAPKKTHGARKKTRRPSSEPRRRTRPGKSPTRVEDAAEPPPAVDKHGPADGVLGVATTAASEAQDDAEQRFWAQEAEGVFGPAQDQD